MKLIEALKKVKSDREKIGDLVIKIRKHSARMESHRPEYSKPDAQVDEWIQGIFDTQKNISALLTRIQKTNLQTNVTIEIGGNQVVKTISEWIVRRREGVDFEILAYKSLTNMGLKPCQINDEEGNAKIDQVVLHFDAKKRDEKLSILVEEKHLIDSALEIINATTDLVY